MARDLLPLMIIIGALLFGAVVLSGLRVAKWRQPGERWYHRFRRRPRERR